MELQIRENYLIKQLLHNKNIGIHSRLKYSIRRQYMKTVLKFSLHLHTQVG